MSDHDPLALLTPEQVCDLLQIKRSYLYDQVQAGHLPAVRLKRLLRFRRADIETFLEQQLTAS